MFVSIINEKNKPEHSIIDMLEEQYLKANNKKDIDYWAPLSQIILESIIIRDSKNMSQADLAKEMDTRQSVISRFENMGRTPNYDFIARLALALGHTPGMTLFGDFMAVVPFDKQSLIKKMAENENVSTVKYVQDLLEKSIKANTFKKIDTPIKIPDASFQDYDVLIKSPQTASFYFDEANVATTVSSKKIKFNFALAS
jgi:transcriptional regulator with XRE-family HTH domain